ncbi:MAG: hypothetical protein D3924_00770 [Candidatus Electrothrix sp. AR4]|nr:hypothetical protein [Candidatus Electrothrix sp. AR4]
MQKNDQKKTPQEHQLSQPVNRTQETDSVNHDRRSVIRKIAVGTAALAGCSVLPEKWTAPFVEFGTLPAHTTTSGAEEIPQELIDIIEQRENAETAPPAAEETGATREAEAGKPAAPAEDDDLRGYENKLTLHDSGALMYCDGVYQHKIVFPQLGPQYGASFLLVWSDGNELFVPNSKSMIMNTSKSDARKYQPGYPYSSNHEIRTMEVYAKRGTHPDSVTLYY